MMSSSQFGMLRKKFSHGFQLKGVYMYVIFDLLCVIRSAMVIPLYGAGSDFHTDLVSGTFCPIKKHVTLL